MHVGEELGRGVRSVVYALDSDRVIKLPDPGTPDAWIDEELRIADSVARSGAPVPDGREIVSVDGRTGLVSERIDGPSMWEVVCADRDRAGEFGRELAAIQIAVWQRVPSYELPRQCDRIEAKIIAAARRYGADLLAALDLIDRCDEGLVVCHGDLHPRNVLLAPSGPLLVDWFDAARGCPAGDVARTQVILTSDPVPDTIQPSARGSSTEVVPSEFVTSYLEAVLASDGCDPTEVERWRIVQTVARLAEGFGTSRLSALRDELAAIPA